MADAYIIDAVRTPRGRGKPLGTPKPGALAGVHPQELAAQVLRAVTQRTGVAPGDVEDVILGVVTQADRSTGRIAFVRRRACVRSAPRLPRCDR